MIIDRDSHCMPRDAFDYVDARFEGLKPRLSFDEQWQVVALDFPGWPEEVPGVTPLPPAKGSGSRHPGNTDMDVRIQEMERMGVDRQMLYPQFTGWWSSLIEPELAASVAHSHNLARLKIMRDYPGKFLGAALLALQDVERAIEELEWARDNGFQAAIVDQTYPVWEHPFGTPLGMHRELWPLFARVAELDILIVFHTVNHGHRLSNLPIYHHDGLDIFAPNSAHVNLVSLITSGLLDEFPELQFIQTETGTKYIKPLAQRLDERFERQAATAESVASGATGPRRPSNVRRLVPPEVSAPKNKKLPSSYFKHNFSWTIETEEPELPESVEFLGAERFLFATDYPHDDPAGAMKFQDVALFSANTQISESDKALIRNGNAVRIFHVA